MTAILDELATQALVTRKLPIMLHESQSSATRSEAERARLTKHNFYHFLQNGVAATTCY